MKKFPIINTKLLETKKVIERIKLRKNYSNKLLEESNIKFMNKIKINKGQELDYTPMNSYNGLETTLNTSESSPTSQISYISNYSLNKFKSEENICKVVKGQWKKKLDLEENFEFINIEKCNQFFNHVINFFNNENNHDSKNILDIVKKDYEQRLDNFKNNKSAWRSARWRSLVTSLMSSSSTDVAPVMRPMAPLSDLPKPSRTMFPP